MTTVTDGHGPCGESAAGCESLPIDLQGISDVVDRALTITLCVPDRQDIDLMAGRLRGALNLFVVEDLGFAKGPEVRQMYREAHRLVELNARPDADTSPFTAYEYTRELGRLTRRFVDLYREHHPAEACDD